MGMPFVKRACPNEKATRRTTDGSLFPDRLHSSARTLNSLSAVPHLSTQSLSPHGSEFRLRPHPAVSGGIPWAFLGLHATPVDVWTQQCPQKLTFWCVSPFSRTFPSWHRTRRLALRPGPNSITEASSFPLRFLVRTFGPSQFPQLRPCDVLKSAHYLCRCYGCDSTPCSQVDS